MDMQFAREGWGPDGMSETGAVGDSQTRLERL
jgi:hypothetical protein